MLLLLLLLLAAVTVIRCELCTTHISILYGVCSNDARPKHSGWQQCLNYVCYIHTHTQRRRMCIQCQMAEVEPLLLYIVLARIPASWISTGKFIDKISLTEPFWLFAMNFPLMRNTWRTCVRPSQCKLAWTSWDDEIANSFNYLFIIILCRNFDWHDWVTKRKKKHRIQGFHSNYLGKRILRRIFI